MRRGELFMKSWPQCVALLSLLAGSKGHGLHARVLTTFHLHVCAYIYINISYIIHTTMLFCRLYACLLPELCTAKNGCWAYTRDILRWLLGKSLACSCLIPAHRISSYNLRLGRCVINGVRTNRQPQIHLDSKRCKTDHRMCYPQTAVEMWQQCRSFMSMLV